MKSKSSGLMVRGVEHRSERAQAMEWAEEAARKAHRRMNRAICGLEIDRGPDVAPVVRFFAKVLGGVFVAIVAALMVANG